MVHQCCIGRCPFSESGETGADIGLWAGFGPLSASGSKKGLFRCVHGGVRPAGGGGGTSLARSMSRNRPRSPREPARARRRSRPRCSGTGADPVAQRPAGPGEGRHRRARRLPSPVALPGSPVHGLSGAVAAVGSGVCCVMAPTSWRGVCKGPARAGGSGRSPKRRRSGVLDPARAGAVGRGARGHRPVSWWWRGALATVSEGGPGMSCPFGRLDVIRCTRCSAAPSVNMHLV